MNDPTPNPPPTSKWTKARSASALTTAGIVLVYGAFFRWFFTWDLMEAAGGVVSLAFIFSVPVACGVIAVALGRMFGSETWWLHALLIPGATMLAGLVLTIIFRIEAVICVVMAMPIVLGGALLGGLLGHVLLPRDSSRPHLHVTFAVFIPFVAAWVEGAMHQPSEMKAITNTIVIEAPAERIWPEIASVEAIPGERIRNRWIYWIGFPKPIAATLDHDGVGGVRIATFERDVSFFEEAWWSVQIMDQIQGSILEVIRERAEEQPGIR